jgi:hypothetical protein
MSKENHEKTVANAEATRQAAKAATNTDAGHRAADIAFYTSVLKSGQTEGVKTNALQALLNLGAPLPSLTGAG